MSDTTAISEAQFAAALLRVVQAIEDSDYDTADMRLDAAWAILHGLPGSASGSGVATARAQSLKDLGQRIAERRLREDMDSGGGRIINVHVGRTDHGG